MSNDSDSQRPSSESQELKAVASSEYANEKAKDIEIIIKQLLEEQIRGGLDLPEGAVDRISKAAYQRVRRLFMVVAFYYYNMGVVETRNPPKPVGCKE